MRLGIVGAMDSELAHLKGKLADVQVSRSSSGVVWARSTPHSACRHSPITSL